MLQCYVVCRSASLDVEPLYTFRCHTGPVLCLAMSATGEQCYSGGLDGAIHCWNLPCANIDPYDSFGMCAFTYVEIRNMQRFGIVRFEVCMAVTMRNAVFCDVTLCGSCKN
jgi:WD40 repeat protein